MNMNTYTVTVDTPDKVAEIEIQADYLGWEDEMLVLYKKADKYETPTKQMVVPIARLLYVRRVS